MKDIPITNQGTHVGYFPEMLQVPAVITDKSFSTCHNRLLMGNSGGPVFDEFGQVVGIATKGITADNLVNILFNGCIPMHTIDRVIFIDF